MKTPAQRIILSSALVCSIILLGLGISATGKESRRGMTVSPPTPETQFTDNVVINTGGSPRLTLTQNTSLGQPAREWNVTGNSSNFFISDATAGTTCFSILPGAPSASLTVASSGNVGVGTFSPAEGLHIAREFSPSIRLQQTAAGSARSWTMRGSQSAFSVIDETAGTTPVRVVAGTG